MRVRVLLFRGRVMVRFWVSVLGVGGKVRGRVS